MQKAVTMETTLSDAGDTEKDVIVISDDEDGESNKENEYSGKISDDRDIKKRRDSHKR